MEYPLISEYIDSILSSEDNFSELTSLRPVLDGNGKPVMSSGNFAVVFKMKDESDGKTYAVKCFLKDQKGRDESYRKIADELEVLSSSYILPLRYLENELFVDSGQCDCEEFPVVVMEWVEGETLDSYLQRYLKDKYELEMLSYHFNRMSAWLLSQPFAHGDLKPDNILVRKDGTLVLVDYDGMFVPSMKGEKAREIGTPGYRHPLRDDSDFNEHIDDFSIAVIAMSLKAIALNPDLKAGNEAGDTLLLSEQDIRSPRDSEMIKNIQSLTNNPDLAVLYGIFYIALSKNSLEAISFRLFMTDKPKGEAKCKKVIRKPVEKIDTSCSDKDIAEGIKDEYGVIYSKDGKRLLKCWSNLKLYKYKIKSGTQVICDNAFSWCKSLQSIVIPDSVTSIGKNPFVSCPNIKVHLSSNSNFSIINDLLIDSDGLLISCFNRSENAAIPNSVTSIGDSAFSFCSSLQNIVIPDSVTSIGNLVFIGCEYLQSIVIPDSVSSIGDSAFFWCKSLQSIAIPESVNSIGNLAFVGCKSLQSIVIPDSVSSIGDDAFSCCESLQSIVIPDSVTSIRNLVFSGCESLQSIVIPDSVTSIGNNPFVRCPNIKVHLSLNSNFNIINDLLIDSAGRIISCLNRSEDIVIPDTVTSIGESAFRDCSSLQSIEIPDTVTSIGDNAFYDCESLQNIVMPDSITSIGDSAFSWCESLQNIVIPDSVTSIGDSAFSFCSSLQNIVIPDSVTSIGDSAFSNCNSLKTISISESVEVIGDAFPSSCKVIRRKRD